jgi:hypothetical protein
MIVNHLFLIDVYQYIVYDSLPCPDKRSSGDMAFFTARILSKDGMIIAEEVEVWIQCFRLGNMERWAGSFEVPVTTPMTQRTYRIQLTDGRQGLIGDVTTQIRGDNIVVYFEGKDALA